MGTALQLGILVPVGLGLAASAVTYWQGWAYFSEEAPSRKETSSEVEEEGVSVIVPLRGVPGGSPGRLKSLLGRLAGQEGTGPTEIIVAVEEEDDPATALARSLAQEREEVRLVVADRAFADRRGAPGTGKPANLAAGAAVANYDRLAFVDADVRPSLSALERLLRPLSDPSVGLAFAAQVGARSPNLPAAFNHAYVNDSAMQYGAGAYRGELPGAVGAFMATRRDVLAAVGGLSAFADQIAADIPLGRAVREAGYDLHLLRRPVRVGGDPESWTDVLRRQHRWLVTIRAHFPRFPALAVATALPQTWSLAFLGVAATRGAFLQAGVFALGLVLLWKVGSQAFLNAQIAGDQALWPRLWIALVAEPIWLGAFAWSLLTRRVWWAGRRFDVRPGGTKRLLEES